MRLFFCIIHWTSTWLVFTKCQFILDPNYFPLVGLSLVNVRWFSPQSTVSVDKWCHFCLIALWPNIQHSLPHLLTEGIPSVKADNIEQGSQRRGRWSPSTKVRSPWPRAWNVAALPAANLSLSHLPSDSKLPPVHCSPALFLELSCPVLWPLTTPGDWALKTCLIQTEMCSKYIKHPWCLRLSLKKQNV